MAERCTSPKLHLADAAGLWRIVGVSGSAYVVDAERGLALRQPAEDASTGPFDGCWMTLLGVQSTAGAGVVTVGLRHRWDFDPEPGGRGCTIWWIQTAVEVIERLEPSERPAGRTATRGEDRTPFRSRFGR